MRILTRKIYMSILVCGLCLFTFFATTYAWVGILTESTFDKFQINLKVTDLLEYGVEISLTGEEGTFGSEVDQVELKKILLSNMGYNMDLLQSDEAINRAFSQSTLRCCSAELNADNTFSEFKDIDDRITKKYFKFDLYVSPVKTIDTADDSNYYLDVYLIGDLFEGTVRKVNLINKFVYPSDFVNNVVNGIQPNTIIKDNVNVDSSSACRLSIQKYNVVEKGKPEQYEDNSEILDCIIYQDGTETPTYDSVNDIYCFGGILEEKYNLALSIYNQKFPQKKKVLPDWALNRGDIIYSQDNLNQLVHSSNSQEKVSLSQMMKLTICFWFDGWDSDCFEVIDNSPVKINLNFTNNIIML